MFNPENLPPPPQEVEKSPEKEKPVLSYDDVLYLSQESIGLRHVTGHERAEQEKTKGIEMGDAIATGSFTNLIRPEEMKELKDSIKDKETVNRLEKGYPLKDIISMGGISLPESLKAELTTRFGETLKGFMSGSLEKFGLTGSMKRDESADSVINKIVKSEPNFLVGKFNNADKAYDVDRFYPMGKCGKINVPPENIYNSFTIDRKDFEGLALEKKADEVISYASQALYDKFLNQIHELRQSKEK